MRTHLPPIFERLDSRMLLSAGDFDPAFNNGALLKTAFDNGSCAIADVKALPDGGMIAAGTIRVRNGSGLTGHTLLSLVKYKFDGSLDTTFGAGGKIAATPRNMAGGFKLQLTPDGGFIVMGAPSTSGDINDASGGEFLLKFTAAGKVDTTFGKNGVLKPSDRMSSFTVDPHGRILIEGWRLQGQATASDAILTRYTRAGRLDTTFGTNGQFVVSAPASLSMNFNSIAFDAQGRILAGLLRRSGVADQNSLIIYRLTDKGGIDRNYANNGSTAVALAYNGDSYDGREIARVLDDGSIILRGRTIVRVNANGQLDTNYGTGGTAEITLNWQTQPLAPVDGLFSRELYNQFAVGADGSVVYVPYTPGLELIRINPQGHIDASFASAGTVALEPTADPTDGYLTAVDIAPDGSIVAAGEDGSESASGKVDTRAGVVGRVLGGAGPAVQIVPRTITKSTRYLSITCFIRDTDKVDLGTLDNSDLKLFDVAGSTRRFRFVSSEDVDGDGKYIAARYRIIGPKSAAWSSAANGTYQVRLQRKQIADTKLHFAAAQVLGTVRVSIA